MNNEQLVELDDVALDEVSGGTGAVEGSADAHVGLDLGLCLNLGVDLGLGLGINLLGIRL
jgi:hypothetical protein